MDVRPRRRPPLSGPLVWVLAWRFLRGRHSRLLSGTGQAALISTGLGVAAMVIAMALMTGYQEDLERKLTSGNAAVLALPIGLQVGELDGERQAALAALPGVARVDPVILGQGVLTSAGDAQGVEVTLRGVEPGDGPFSARPEQLAADAAGLPGVVLGTELAHRLSVGEGDVLRLVAVGFRDGRPRFRYQSVRCTSTFASGFSEFDRSWLLLERRQLAELIGPEGASTMYEVAPADLDEAARLVTAVEELLGPRYLVTSWLDLNRQLFTALRLQKLLLFLVLGLIVFVSTFNVASTLVVSVRERMRDVGTLGALGLAPGRLWRVFLLYGALLGASGVAAGVALGGAVAWVFNTFELIRFDAEVAAIYFLDAVRFRVRLLDLAAVVAFALAVNLLACLLPARRAARVDPCAALRYE